MSIIIFSYGCLSMGYLLFLVRVYYCLTGFSFVRDILVEDIMVRWYPFKHIGYFRLTTKMTTVVVDADTIGVHDNFHKTLRFNYRTRPVVNLRNCQGRVNETKLGRRVYEEVWDLARRTLPTGCGEIILDVKTV